MAGEVERELIPTPDQIHRARVEVWKHLTRMADLYRERAKFAVSADLKRENLASAAWYSVAAEAVRDK